MSAKKVIRASAWLLFGAIAFATLGPIELRPRLEAPVNIERAFAFALLGLAFAAAYPRRIWWAVAFVILAAVGLELLQNLRPHRHGREVDALAKIAGASIGLGLGWIIARIATRTRAA